MIARASILAFMLTVCGCGALEKIYDGDTDLSVYGTPSISDGGYTLYVSPAPAFYDCVGVRGADGVVFAYAHGAFSSRRTGAYGSNVSFSKHSLTMPLAFAVGAVPSLVRKVGLMGAPSKVACSVVHGAAILVTAFCVNWSTSVKCEKHSVMYGHQCFTVSAAKFDVQVTRLGFVSRKHLTTKSASPAGMALHVPPVQPDVGPVNYNAITRSHPPHVRDFVISFPGGDGLPNFAFKIYKGLSHDRSSLAVVVGPAARNERAPARPLCTAAGDSQ